MILASLLLAGAGQTAYTDCAAAAWTHLDASTGIYAGCAPPKSVKDRPAALQNVSIKHLPHAQLRTCIEQPYGEMRCNITPDPNPKRERKHRHIVLKIVTGPLIPLFWLGDLWQAGAP
jgi:hypothetical protein